MNEYIESALRKREAQGWVKEVATTLDDCMHRIKRARAKKETTSIAYLGNIVDLWEKFVEVCHFQKKPMKNKERRKKNLEGHQNEKYNKRNLNV
jgi:urocanate hydratase